MSQEMVVITNKSSAPYHCVMCGLALTKDDVHYNEVKDHPELLDIECWNEQCKHEYRLYRRSGTWSWYEQAPESPPKVILMEDMFPSLFTRIKNWFKDRVHFINEL